MKSKKINIKTLNDVKAETKDLNMREKAEKLAEKLNSESKATKTTKSKTKKTNQSAKTETTEKTKRDVKAYAIVPVTEQTNYEQRFYMRDYHKDEKNTVVRHKTSHGIKSSSEQCLEFMRQMRDAESSVTMFTTSDLIKAISSYGPSYGDVVRNAMRKLAKQNLVVIHKIADNERTRAKNDNEKYN